MICARRDCAGPFDRQVLMEARAFHGLLLFPENAFATVVMPFDASASRVGSVQQSIAESLLVAGLATCLVDLMQPDEAEAQQQAARRLRLLIERLNGTLDVLSQLPDTRSLPLGLLGTASSTEAVLAVAARRAASLGAVVCCCGRPDRSPIDLAETKVPTLLVVPGKERRLVEANERTFASLNCPSQLAVILGASRNFEEAGTMAACQYVIGQWCQQHLRAAERLFDR
ncbi:MAG: hypothetical protein WD847_06090 [Pirellulales bacterium]